MVDAVPLPKQAVRIGMKAASGGALNANIIALVSG